jgi:hypothetical protein
MDQHIINLYDHFTHGGMSRRDFMERLITLAGSAAAATAMLPLLQNNYAQAQIVPPNDPGLPPEKWSRLNVSPRPVFEREINQDASETVHFRTDHQQVERC